MRPARVAALGGALLLLPFLTTPEAVQASTEEPAPAAGVTAAVETPPLFDDDAGGNADADDPAIWVHPRDAARSLVIVTAKDAGLRVYDVAGRQVQAIAAPPAPGEDDEAGRFNNVDVVYGVQAGRGRADLAIVSDRGRDQLRIFRIDPVALDRGAPPLRNVTATDAPFAFSADQDEVNEQSTAYGVTAFVADGTAYAVASRRHTTELGVFRLRWRDGAMTYERVDALRLPAHFELPNGTTWRPCDEPGVDPQVEGMVVDLQHEVLYAAQEDVALWRIELDLDDAADGEVELEDPEMVERVREFGVPASYDPNTEECTLDWTRDLGHGGDRISADVEGLTIYQGGDESGYLLVSSQGDSGFLVYDRDGNDFLGRFDIVDGPHSDGVQHADGAAVVNVPLGTAFLAGLLVVHDGEETPTAAGQDGEPRESTNVKFIDWRAVADPLGLRIDPFGADPRR